MTGDVDTEDVFRAAADRFRKWKRAEDPFAGEQPAPMAPLTRSSVVVSTSHAMEATVRIEFRGPGLDTDSAGVPAMETLVAFLGRPGSPFLRDMVMNGPFHELDCDFERSRSAGTIVFQGSADLLHAATAATQLADTLDYVEQYLTEPNTAGRKLQELDRALVVEERAVLAPYMAELWAQGEALYLEGTSDADYSTRDELVRVARTYLEGKPRVIGVIVPPSVADTIRTEIEQKEGGR